MNTRSQRASSPSAARVNPEPVEAIPLARGFFFDRALSHSGGEGMKLYAVPKPLALAFLLWGMRAGGDLSLTATGAGVLLGVPLG
jgi:hypothetical protein